MEKENHGAEAETDHFKVDTNIIAAGYDDEDDLWQTDGNPDDTAEKGFGVQVNKAGIELKEVSGNPDTVVQETFDVKCTAGSE